MGLRNVREETPASPHLMLLLLDFGKSGGDFGF